MKYILVLALTLVSHLVFAEDLDLKCKDASGAKLDLKFDPVLLDFNAKQPEKATITYSLNGEKSQSWTIPSFMTLPIGGKIYLEFRSFEVAPTSFISLTMNPDKTEITSTALLDRTDFDMTCTK